MPLTRFRSFRSNSEVVNKVVSYCQVIVDFEIFVQPNRLWMSLQSHLFPLILDRVVKYFDRFVDQSNKDIKNELWLDYDGQPIKWHHPIGLSWDLFGSSSDLAWRLILHFSKFPTEELVRCSTKESIEACFMNCVNEADALKHRSSVMRNLVKKECNQLWSGLVNDKFEHFWQVNKKLMERTDDEPFKSVPFRLHFPDSTHAN